MVGIKYARNARASFKKLFEKVKANATASGSGDDSDDAAPAPAAKKTSATKKTTPAKPTGVTKKETGKPVATKKAVATRARVPRKVQKAIKEEATDVNERLNSSELEENDQEVGKFFNTFTPINAKKISRGGDVNEPISGDQVSLSGYQASTSGNEAGLADDDEHQAELRGMSVEDWRAWKLQNPYDDGVYSHAPTPNTYRSEDEA